MTKKNLPIITFMNKDQMDEPWESYIDCQCQKCGVEFNQDTDDLDLDADESLAKCPNCGNESKLQIIERKNKSKDSGAHHLSIVK